MVLNGIFGALACLSLLLLLWQWLAALRFPLRRRIDVGEAGVAASRLAGTPAPPVTLLKPLKGCDAETENCLRSWFAQNYAGEIQFLFGVASADDPVCEIVRKLKTEFPECDAELIVCDATLGANAKVSKLAALQKLAKHGILAISDADVHVPPDFLGNVIVPLSPSDGERMAGGRVRGEVGVVNCFYCLANPATLAMQWEAIAINADFWSQVLQSQTLKPLDFALGAVMVTRRKFLEEIGGFESLVNCLADDYQLGNRIAERGLSIFISPVVVECRHAPQTWREVWKHQLRWARTIRVCQPAPYFFSILSNPTLWPLIWFVVTPNGFSAGFLAASPFIRAVITENLLHRFTQKPASATLSFLAPIKDLLQAAIWLCAFAGNKIEWRGQKFILRRDGTLQRK